MDLIFLPILPTATALVSGTLLLFPASAFLILRTRYLADWRLQHVCAQPPPAPMPQPSTEEEAALQPLEYPPWLENPPDSVHAVAAALIINLCFRLQGGRALTESSWAAIRQCFNRRDREWLSLPSWGLNFHSPVISAHFRSFPATAADICTWCSDRLTVSGVFDNCNSGKHSYQVRDSS